MSKFEELSTLQKSMALLIAVFHSHSGKEGDKYKLNKAELKSLLKEEFSSLSCNNPKEMDNIMRELDGNRDGEVDFKEFVVLVVALTMLANDFFEESRKAK